MSGFVANLKIDAIYALYPESFSDKNLAFRKVFVFCDSVEDLDRYILDFVGSVQCRHHKGTEIITQVPGFSF